MHHSRHKRNIYLCTLSFQHTFSVILRPVHILYKSLNFILIQDDYCRLTGLPHHNRVPTLVFSSDVYFRDDDQDAASFLRSNAPRTFHVGRIESRPIGTLHEALLPFCLSETSPIWQQTVKSSASTTHVKLCISKYEPLSCNKSGTSLGQTQSIDGHVKTPPRHLLIFC